MDSLNFRRARFVLLLIASHAAAFEQEVARKFTTQDGLPSNDVIAVAVIDGKVLAKTAKGVAKFTQGRWIPDSADFPAPTASLRNYSTVDGRPYDQVTSLVA